MDHRAIRREYIVGGRGLDDLLGGRGNDIIEAAPSLSKYTYMFPSESMMYGRVLRCVLL